MARIWGRAAAPLLFLALFTLYAYWCYPTVAPRDSADLAAAAMTLAPAHAPGYPLYSLLGKAWLFLLPWGEPAYRLNLMAAAAGAGAAALLFVLLRRACGLWAGLGAALGLAFCLPLWKFSLLCEMYSLHAFFLALLLALAPGPGQDAAGAPRRAACSALILGLALVNHQAFVLAVPGLAALWWRERDIPLRPCLALLMLGLALYAFLWVREPGRAWALLTRQEYGTLQLSAGFSRPWSLALAASLLAHLAGGLWNGLTWPILALAGVGAVELYARDRRFGSGLALLMLAFGPGFFLLTRFDLSGWVARTVLETSFIAPAVVVCAAAGFGLARLPRGRAAAALAVGAFAFASQAGGAWHRDDFCAYDYVKDLRRALPPGAAAVAAGDTALYASRYLDLAHPDGKGRRLIHYQDRQDGFRPRWVLGLPLERAAGLQPAGLVQTREGADERVFWEVSVLRPGRALRLGESYARDVLLSYAFARYLSGALWDARQDPRAARHYLQASALDPEDYQIEYNSAHAAR